MILNDYLGNSPARTIDPLGERLRLQICIESHKFSPMGVQAAVLGASGYAGGELLRYLAGHPAIDVTAVAAGTKAGRDAAEVLPHLAGSATPPLASVEEVLETRADVLFSCLPSGRLPAVDGGRVVVDLSDDHRADPGWTYGLPELDRVALEGTSLVANPGCYPTAALLCLAPFASAGLIEGPVIIDAMSGTSGAGRKEADHLLHATLESSVSAYGTVEHRHVPEIERGLATFGGLETVVSFTPHLVPMSRGLLVTARAPVAGELEDGDAIAVLADAYESEFFVSVTEAWPVTKSVSGTNRAVVSARVDRRARMLVCSAAIDNLGKGAAGQAIQNANIALGLGETTGLEGFGVWP